MPTPDASTTTTTDTKAAPAARTTALSSAAAAPADKPVDKQADGKDAAAPVVDDAAAGELFTDVKQLKTDGGLTLDEAVMKEFLPLAGGLKLTAGQVQKLVEFNATLAKKSEAAREAALDAAAEKAAESLKADKDIGGAKFEASMKLAGRALHKFGGAELAEAFSTMRLADGSFLGDSPVLAKLLVAVGKATVEDSVGGALGTGGKPKTPASDDGAFHKALYPKSPGLKVG